jgi:hypothetical protein
MGLRTWSLVTGGTSGSANFRGGFRWQVTNSDADRILNNRSVVRVEAMAYKTSSFVFNLSANASYYVVDGQTSNYTTGIDLRSPATNYTYYYVNTDTAQFPNGSAVKYADFTIYHTSNGTKTVNVNAFIGIPGTSAAPGIQTISNITLPTIPRTSTFTAPTAGFNYTIGNDLTINVDKKDPSFADEVTIYTNGVLIKTIPSFVNQTVVFTSTEIDDMYASTPNASTCTMTIRVTTKNSGGTTIGSNDVSGTAFVTNAFPIFTDFSAYDSNATTVALTGSNSIIVKGYSTITGLITVANKATAQKSATMANYKMVCGEQTQIEPYSDVSDVAINITNAQLGNVTVSAIDSRALSTTVAKSLSLVEYFKPVIESFEVSRPSASEVVNLTTSGTWFNQSFGTSSNTLTLRYRYKETSSSTWSGYTTLTGVSTPGDTFSFNNNILGDTGTGFDETKSYDIEMEVLDELESGITATGLISSSTPEIHVKTGKVSIAGTVKDSDDSVLQVYGDISAGNIYESYAMAYTSNATIPNTTFTSVPFSGLTSTADWELSSTNGYLKYIGTKTIDAWITGSVEFNPGWTDGSRLLVGSDDDLAYLQPNDFCDVTVMTRGGNEPEWNLGVRLGTFETGDKIRFQIYQSSGASRTLYRASMNVVAIGRE